MTTFTDLTPTQRSITSNIMVAHSNALMRAGLVATIQRISGCKVHTSEDTDVGELFGMPLQGIDLLVVDPASLRLSAKDQHSASVSMPALKKPSIVLLTATEHPRVEPTPAHPRVSAYLSPNCRQDDLLSIVCGLLGTSVSISCQAGGIKPDSLGSAYIPARSPRGGLAPAALRRVREHIEKNLATHIDLGDLSSLAGLSSCHFSRAFKQSMNMPPHRYLMARRVQAAARMIEATESPISEIALEVGFSDQSHFTRVFRAQLGEAPGRFRRLHR